MDDKLPIADCLELEAVVLSVVLWETPPGIVLLYRPGLTALPGTPLPDGIPPPGCVPDWPPVVKEGCPLIILLPPIGGMVL